MLTFDNINAQIPQTHVLIIGVGHYQYLKGGENEKPQKDGLNSLGQLTSTTASAKAFHKTMLGLHTGKSWITPLGSIDILISEPINGGGNFEVPNRNNVDQAYTNWKIRCDAHEENVAIFFFAGHGLENEGHHLLLEDFGANINAPWKGAFEFNDTRMAFQACNAQAQCFLVDACRQVNSILVNNRITSLPLESPPIRATECPYNLTIKGAARNEMAYGISGQASYFTETLIRAFEGYASIESGVGDWIVDMSSIASEISNILKIVNEEEDYKQRFSKIATNSIELVKLSKPPKARLKVMCDPNEALTRAELGCTKWDEVKSSWSKNKKSRPAESTPWTLELEAGMYLLEASFSGEKYRSNKIPKHVKPPITEETLKCSKL